MAMKPLLLGLALTGLAACGGAEATPKDPATTQITKEQARDIALAKIPGEVVDEEYEREGAGWVYGFEIRPADGGGVKEIEIDAATGKVLEIEDADDDEDEAEDDDDGDGPDDD